MCVSEYSRLPVILKRDRPALLRGALFMHPISSTTVDDMSERTHNSTIVKFEQVLFLFMGSSDHAFLYFAPPPAL
jgi:hypothetical protein